MRHETNTKHIILDAATSLFSSQGFKATSMTDIAKKSKVSKAALYYFFRNKEHIYETIVDAALVNLRDTIGSFIGKKIPLETLFSDLIARAKCNCALVHVIDIKALHMDQTIFKDIRKRMQEVQAELAKVLEERHIPNSRIASECILDSIHTYAIHVHFGASKIKPKEFSAFLSSLFKQK